MSKKLVFVVSFVLMVSQACNAVEVARWDFEETSGTTATDGIASLVITLQGSASLNVDGRFGSGVDFPGEGAVAEAAGIDALRFTGDFSIALWINSDVAFGDYTRFVDISAADGGLTDSYRLFTGSGASADNFRFMSRQNGSNTQDLHTRDMAVGTWILLVLRNDLDGDVTMNVLQDGDSVDAAFVAANSESWPTAGSIVYAAGDLKFGQMNSGGRAFDGQMDGIAFYDEVLSDDQVVRIFSTAAASKYPLASGPDPADGAMLEATWANLDWRAGDYAVSHDLYFGTGFDDVNDGAEGTFLGNQAATKLIVGFPGFAFPDGLVPGTTYYWRIDEVNDTEPNSPWKGNVWSFTVPPRTAFDLIPADGVKFVDPNVELSWTGGFGAKLHTVYFGNNFDDVNNAVVGLPQAETTYTPGTLELDKVYYWRIDEFDGAATHKGDVLSFRTMPVIDITDPSLIGWWKFDAGVGTIAPDWSGHGNHGLIVSPQWLSPGWMGESALNFGTGSYVAIRNLVLNDANSTDVTVSAWIRTSSIGMQTIASFDRSEYWRFEVDGYADPGEIGWSVSTSTGTVDLASQKRVDDGLWHHVAGVFDNGVMTIYIDGALDASVTGGSTFGTGTGRYGFIASQSEATVFDGDRSGSPGHWIGGLDDVRIYDKALTQEEILVAMRGDLLLAWGPKPTPGSTLYIRDATPLNWSPGDNASGHDVYFGTDRDAVADANASDTTGIYRGRQGVTFYSPPEVEWGGGPYYWRVDEYNTDATISKGNVWSFTVTDFIEIDGIEDYNDYPPDEIFSTWIDGWEVPTNGSTVGYPDPNFDQGEHFVETNIVHGGVQSMPYFYENNFKYSEATMTLVSVRDWTEEGVGVLSLWFYGDAANAAERMYVNLNGIATVYHDNPDAALIDEWTEWTIDLQEFAAQGVNLANVNTISIGFGDKNNLQAGGSGLVFFDDIRLYRPAPPEPEPAP